MLKQWKVGIFLFDEVEVLDFAGPFEAFSLTMLPGQKEKPFLVQTVSQKAELIMARNGLRVLPDYSFDNAPEFDILVIPGGYGAEEIEIRNEPVIGWIREQGQRIMLLASVCTGAFLLAKAGLLDGRRATTHWMDIDRLTSEFPDINVIRDVKFVDEDAIITSGGVSAGINMSLHIIERLLGSEISLATAKRMEYDL